ncbi:MerR family transcriptional regulator [Actinomadura madurae]|uniref:MerR family transcriptional regulator n=1 Tax=Actinomadura madurae TaxID=1993 RepID=UPI0020D20BFD|nr:MerR family transcriptional regulator [Actinomadura madurae]MCP9981963.1 helix-turn-helix domain-containing protein [Actinomadura madurae]MCQ0006509.1 helix-turn-helix domain-containing protein [Actinomadura madurae]
MERTWTIGELAEDAAAALAADGSAQASGRVRDLPNERLIRWYTTIGLVDPPLGRRGRTSLYGPRHLLQLVAVKRRQAAGRSIAEIQLELAGATNTTLAQIAALPTPLAPTPPMDSPGSVRPTGSSGSARSVGRRLEPARIAGADDETAADPEAPATSAGGPGGSISPAADSLGGEERQPGSAGEGSREREGFWRVRPDVSYREATVAGDYRIAHHAVVQGVRLVPGLTMLLDVPTLSGDDLAAIETAARPLLDELRRRGLLPVKDPTEASVKGPPGVPTTGPAEGPAGDPFIGPAEDFAEGPVGDSTGDPAGALTRGPADGPAGSLAEGATDSAADTSADTSADSAADPAADTTEGPATDSAGGSAETPAFLPAAQPRRTQ